MKVIDNRASKFGNDLKKEIKANDSCFVASAVFSMYGFYELKKELKNVKELDFIFTNPTFIKEKKDSKIERIFELDNFKREKSISGSEFEIKLKNKLNGRAIARECAEWIKNKAKFKSNINNNPIQKFMNINDKITYLNVDEFSSAGLGYQKDNTVFNPVTKIDDNYEMTKYYLQSFMELWNNKSVLKDVTDDVIDFISDLYKENSPEFIYYVILYNIFNEFLLDVSEDELANEKTGFKESVIWNKLYDFQKDAVLGIINKLEKYNGCILADSVGLGKTFTALAVIKYYQERNKSVLVLCPKKLANNWNTYNNEYKDNILAKDRFNYRVLYHTDLSRKKGMSGNIDLSRINWGNFDLVVIDESHNFRNNSARNDRETRYTRLLNDVMKAGVKTKVLMLSATPVNNRFTDLKNQLALAYEGNTDKIDENISKTKSIDTILKNAQTIFNEWSKLPIEERDSQSLLRRLNEDFDFFKLLDSVTIARSRKHIEKYYDMNKIGKFPTRLKPISITSEITNIDNFYSVKEIYDSLTKLSMCVYTPFDYILPNCVTKYEDLYDTKVRGGASKLKQSDREKSLQKLMRINLLKRLESSVDSFRLTISKILNQINFTIDAIKNFETNGTDSTFDDMSIKDYEEDEDILDLMDNDFSIGGKVKINLKDMNTIGWKEDLMYDQFILSDLLKEFQRIQPNNDLKLTELINLIRNKIENPINAGNKKVIVFSAFADTANYIYENVSKVIKLEYGLDTALVTGGGANKCTMNIDKDYNNLLINFSPISKNRDILEGKKDKKIDILIATDCISEGQNLQDCDYLVNYDIHWNPVRIIQRFGRIDRIGSKNSKIQLVNFWPNMNLDDYINLKNRVESRMYMLDISATGEDNVLTNQSSDMEYRKAQLQKLKEEVVDIEDMNTGVSITDLGLNDYRMDLVEYINHNGNLDYVSNGMHSVVLSDEQNGIEKGTIFILKNINANVNIENTNQLHPFYIVYIKENGEILSNHLNVKNTLDLIRYVSKGKKEPVKEAYTKFNEITNDGNDMSKYSDLLNKSITSIIDVKEESDIDSLFRKGGTTMLKNDISGLDDFELIAFVAIV